MERPIPKERPPDQVAREALEGGPGALSPVRSLYAYEQRVQEREGRDASKPRATTTATTQQGEGEAGGQSPSQAHRQHSAYSREASGESQPATRGSILPRHGTALVDRIAHIQEAMASPAPAAVAPSSSPGLPLAEASPEASTTEQPESQYSPPSPPGEPLPTLGSPLPVYPKVPSPLPAVQAVQALEANINRSIAERHVRQGLSFNSVSPPPPPPFSPPPLSPSPPVRMPPPPPPLVALHPPKLSHRELHRLYPDLKPEERVRHRAVRPPEPGINSLSEARQNLLEDMNSQDAPHRGPTAEQLLAQLPSSAGAGGGSRSERAKEINDKKKNEVSFLRQQASQARRSMEQQQQRLKAILRD